MKLVGRRPSLALFGRSVSIRDVSFARPTKFTTRDLRPRGSAGQRYSPQSRKTIMEVQDAS